MNNSKKIVRYGLTFTPCGDVVLRKEVGNKIIIGYTAQDDFDAEACERDWNIYTAHRSSSWKELYNFREALGLDESYQKDASIIANRWAVKLDVYQHGGVQYSVSDEGIQRQFDTARGGAVWVPDESLESYFESMHQGFGATARDVDDFCRGCLEEYNAIANGEIYGVCVDTLDASGKIINNESVWGFIGRDHAVESLTQDYFNPAVAELMERISA